MLPFTSRTNAHPSSKSRLTPNLLYKVEFFLSSYFCCRSHGWFVVAAYSQHNPDDIRQKDEGQKNDVPLGVATAGVCLMSELSCRPSVPASSEWPLEDSTVTQTFADEVGYAKRPEESTLEKLIVEWDKPQLDALGNACTIRGKLRIPSRGNNEARPVDWFQGIFDTRARKTSLRILIDWRGMDCVPRSSHGLR